MKSVFSSCPLHFYKGGKVYLKSLFEKGVICCLAGQNYEKKFPEGAIMKAPEKSRFSLELFFCHPKSAILFNFFRHL